MKTRLDCAQEREMRDEDRENRVLSKFRKSKNRLLGGELLKVIKPDGSQNYSTRHVRKHRLKKKLELRGRTLDRELCYRFDPPHPPQPPELEHCPVLKAAFTTLDSSSGLTVSRSELLRGTYPDGHDHLLSRTPAATIKHGLEKRGLNVVSTWGNGLGVCDRAPDPEPYEPPAEKPKSKTISLARVRFLDPST
jgi:hypothetical protein